MRKSKLEYKCLSCGIIFCHIYPRTKHYEDKLNRCFTCIEKEKRNDTKI